LIGSVFKKRLIQPELLDHAEPDAARRNLRDLVRLNHRFGGHSTSVKLVSRVAAAGDRFTLLDVGAASGDTGRLLKQKFPHAQIVSLDNNHLNVEAAPHPKLVGDAFSLPFEAQSFDYVFSSLFLHHFADEQVVQLLSGFRRVARQAVLIIDLERHILPYWFLPVTRHFLEWDPITVHDGPVSVRAAFTRRELERLAAAAGMRHINAEVHRPAFRLSLVGRN